MADQNLKIAKPQIWSRVSVVRPGKLNTSSLNVTVGLIVETHSVSLRKGKKEKDNTGNPERKCPKLPVSRNVGGIRQENQVVKERTIDEIKGVVLIVALYMLLVRKC